MKPFSVLLVAHLSVCGVWAASNPVTATSPKLAALPLSFEPNRGQAAAQVRFVTHSQAATVLFTDSGAFMRLPQGVLEIGLVGAKSRGASGLDPLPGRSNYLVGNDRSRWQTDITTFGRVRFDRIYRGIDLVYHGNQRHLESDFVVSPGADPGKIRLAFRGQKDMGLDADGSLILSLPEGELRQQRPVAYQEIGGVRQAVECAYRLDAHGEAGFQLGPYDRSQTLVIDPVLVYSGRFGGSGSDTPQGVAVDSNGDAYVVGSTYSTDFPTASPDQATSGGSQDAFVTKINAAGTAMVYSTYVGGNGSDYGYGIAVDGSGNAWFTGTANSTNFPWVPSSTRSYAGFVAKLNSSGNSLLVAIPIGDYGYAIAVDSGGNAYATGSTFLGSSQLPIVNAVQPVAGQSYDGWVAKFSPSGSIVYSSFLGGNSFDYGYAIAVDGTGSACIAGWTTSTNFPVYNALQATAPGGGDAFVTKLTPAGNAFVFSTYLGGNASDTARAVAMDSSGNCYVAGQTSSTNFPTANAAQATRQSTLDGFVTAYNTNGTAYLYSTYLGGAGDDDAKAIAVTPSGLAWVTGSTGSLNFPVTADAFQVMPGGGSGGVFQNTGGAGWTSLGLSHNSIALVVDPTNALRMYAGTDGGFYGSADGGATWSPSGLGNVAAIAMSPLAPCSLYAIGGGSDIYYSSNCGSIGSWSDIWSFNGFGPLTALALSGVNPATVWTANSGTLFRRVNVGGNSYSTTWWQYGNLSGALLAADPANPCTLYLGNSAGSVFKKTACSGDDWPWSDTGASFGSAVTAIAAHPTDGATVLAGTANGQIYKKVGTGAWSLLASLSGQVNSILSHPANPLNVYAATANGLVYSSADGGADWNPPVAVSGVPRALAASLAAPSTVDLASFAQPDAFVARLSPAGAITYATFLGGRGTDGGYGIALDPLGAAYVAGQTGSSDFPVTAGVFPGGPGGGTDGFLAKFDPATPVAITVKTSPAGLSFVADGATYTSQQTFNWLSGSSHSISVVSPQTATGTRNLFASWSDGGAAAHSITVPVAAASYTANFTTQYLLTVQTSGSGTVSENPTSADGYYNFGTNVQLTALPTSGYMLTSWSGDLSGNTNPQSVLMNAPHTVTAGFGLLPPPGLRFVPVTPCRVVDTRNAAGPFGGPTMTASSTRSFAVPQSTCGIPSTAQAYSLNVTVVPQGPLGYLSLWPTGQAQPYVSTLNSWGGAVVANAAIVPAGTGGAVSVFVSNPSDVLLDINGYFDSTIGSSASWFYPATPCRVADTRNATGQFGGPIMTTDQTRNFAIPQSSCGIPSIASAYAMNVTVVPSGALGFLTAWPTGLSLPNTSTLNSWTGKVLANAAIVPAGTNEAISVFVTDPTNVILDINGYFGPSGSAGALSFYPVTPCRVADTRNTNGPFGGPEMGASTTRSFAIPNSGCGVPATAAAYSVNVTVVPDAALGYLTIWPTGATTPYVSTLNSWDGSVVANAAIVPAGTGAAISVYVSNASHVILDINGYFAP